MFDTIKKPKVICNPQFILQIYINVSYQWVPKTCCALSNDDPENPRPADLDLCQMEAKMNNGTFTQIYSEVQYNLYHLQGKFRESSVFTGVCVDSYKCLWAFIGCYTRFSGLQSSLGITNGNRSHNKPLELIWTI